MNLLMVDLSSNVIADTLFRVCLLFVAMGVVLVMMNKRYDREKQKRSEMLQEKYKNMTKVLFDEAADEELVEAVVANLHSKLDEKTPDPFYTVPLLSRERTLVYAMWLIDNELKTGGFANLTQTGSDRFFEYAVDGFKAIGAEKCAKAIAKASDAEDAETLNACHHDYLEGAEEELPMEKCVEYIRGNAAAFLDEKLPESEPETAE